jgi:hypothetical protein
MKLDNHANIIEKSVLKTIADGKVKKTYRLNQGINQRSWWQIKVL